MYGTVGGFGHSTNSIARSNPTLCMCTRQALISIIVRMDAYNFDHARIESALDAADIAWWEMEFPSGAIFFSPKKTSILGYDHSDFHHYTKFTELVHKDDYEPMMKAMTDHIEGRVDSYEATYRIKASDGSYKRFRDHGRITKRLGDELILSGVVFEIPFESA